MSGMKELLQAAIAGGGRQPNRTGTQTKDDAKGLADALQRGRKKFLEEHPEAGDRQYFRTPKAPSKKQEAKEAQRKRTELRKQTNVDYTTGVALDLFSGAEKMGYPKYQFTMADFEKSQGLGDYYPGSADFGRGKDKKKRKRRRTAALIAGGIGAAALGGAGLRYGSAALKGAKAYGRAGSKTGKAVYGKSKWGAAGRAAKERLGKDVAAVKSAPGKLYEGAKKRVQGAKQQIGDWKKRRSNRAKLRKANKEAGSYSF